MARPSISLIMMLLSYTGIDGDCEHKRPILRDEMINWNYWQIEDECNDKITIDIRNEFLTFLRKIIVEGSIYDFSKTWKEAVSYSMTEDSFTVEMLF